MTKTATYMTAPRAMLAMGAVGAVIGGAVAAATNYGKVRQGAMTRDAAMKNVLRESGTTGLATATGTAVVGAMGVTGLLSLTGMVLVMAGVKHWADRVIDGKNATALAGNPQPRPRQPPRRQPRPRRRPSPQPKRKPTALRRLAPRPYPTPRHEPRRTNR